MGTRPHSPRSGFGCGVALLVLFSSLGACAEERERPRAEDCLTWEADIAPLLEESCVECHAGEEPAGSYALDSYLGALGEGTDDTPNAIVDEPDALLITKLAAGSDDAVHAAFSDLQPTLRTWAVDCDLALRDSSIHEQGILNPADEDFHGDLLRESGWDFERCAECHGEDFGGGPAESSCLTCHTQGPTDCTTCHDEGLLGAGAHGAHLGDGPLDFDACGTCHDTPEEWDAPGHLLEDESPGAEVRLGGKAAASLPDEPRMEPASWDAEAGQCNNVYCHGGTLDDPAAEVPAPAWTAGADQAACGACHGVPPADHAAEECVHCHSQTVDAEENIVAPMLHIDVEVQVGRPEFDGCSDCHGSERGPAPPTDLLGRTSTDLLTVGAHQAHLRSPQMLSTPVACSACHLVPDDTGDPGHIDSTWPAEVFPETISDTSLAFDRGAMPVWDRDSGTCADVYCHGGGTALADDAARTLLRTPMWTALGEGQAGCGTCHGIPPDNEAHGPTIGLSDCADCHPSSVDEFGRIIFSGPPGDRTTEHMDGDTDVR